MPLVLPVREIVRATPRTRIIRVTLGGRPFSFSAGQALLVGLEGSPLRRPYSIACSPGQAARMDAVELLVQIDDTSSPNPHLERATPGTPLVVEGPFGSFGLPVPLAEQEVLFVAGGTGIAPLRAMLWDALERQTVERIGFLYSARSPDEFAYEPELRQLADVGRLDLRFTVTRPFEDSWSGGTRGRIDWALVSSVLHTPQTRCVLCGPPAMVSAITALLTSAGVEEERILTETYAA